MSLYNPELDGLIPLILFYSAFRSSLITFIQIVFYLICI